MCADAKRDQNRISTLLAVSNVDGVTPVRLWADPITRRLLVDLPSGSGTVTSVSVVTANGISGTVATATTTPAITLTTSITGILKGNGTAISAASAGSDYVIPAGNVATATKLAATKMINGVAFDGSADIVNAFPEGFLINGKIVPSVASNNLTVAIKGLDGNDPSATNPVYCRIGGVVRSITAALSVTKNAATNWCNSGAAELATKEIDYFVYLGYNATDGVVVGFSRIPYANQYSDFSTTTTNEKYAAISIITTAAATDYYNNIGRFAATLSAGAGYTWSVPTFTASNLIQRPIYETRVLLWQPVYSASGSLTWTSNTTEINSYQIVGNRLLTWVGARGTLGGSASTDLIMTAPFSTAIANPPINGTGYDGATYSSMQGYVTGNAIHLFKYNLANWSTSGTGEVSCSVQYLI